MPEESKDKEELNLEVAALRQRVAELKKMEAERQRIEAALRESGKKYRRVVENAAEVIYTTDAKGNFTYSNSAGLKITGYSLDELQRLNYLDLVLPEHRQRLTNIYAGQFQERQLTSYVEFPFLGKAGKVIWFAQNASLVIEDGQVAGFNIIARDITERKRAEEALREREERYRKLLGTMEEGYFEVDLNGNFTLVNDSLCKMFNASSKDDLIGLNNRQYMSEETARWVHKTFNQIYNTDQPAKLFEWEVIKKDGEKALHESSVYLIRNAQEEPIGFRGIVRDITERKKVEEALRESEKAALRLAQETAVIAEIGRIISSTLSIEEVYKLFSEEVKKLLPFDWISISLIDKKKKNTFITRYLEGHSIPGRNRGEVFPIIPGSFSETVIQSRRGIVVGGKSEEEILAQFPSLLVSTKTGMRSFLAVPLISGNQVIGLLHLRSKKDNVYSKQNLELAESIAAQIAGAIANAQLYLELAAGEATVAAEKKKAEELEALNQQLRASEQQPRTSEQQLKAANQQLEAKEQALQKSQTQLMEKLAEVERFNKMMVGRELKMIELKEEINSLLEEMGKPKKY